MNIQADLLMIKHNRIKPAHSSSSTARKVQCVLFGNRDLFYLMTQDKRKEKKAWGNMLTSIHSKKKNCVDLERDYQKATRAAVGYYRTKLSNKNMIKHQI